MKRERKMMDPAAQVQAVALETIIVKVQGGYSYFQFKFPNFSLIFS